MEGERLCHWTPRGKRIINHGEVTSMETRIHPYGFKLLSDDPSLHHKPQPCSRRCPSSSRPPYSAGSRSKGRG